MFSVRAFLAVLMLAAVSMISAQEIPQPAELSKPTTRSGAPLRTAPTSVTDGTHGDIYLNSPAGHETTGIFLLAQPSWPIIKMRIGTSDTTSSFRVTDSGNNALFAVQGDGKVGIGTVTPTHRLEVKLAATGESLTVIGSQAPGIRLNSSMVNSAIRNWAIFSNVYQYGDLHFMRSTANGTEALGGPSAMTFLNNGYAGFGTTDPQHRLEVKAVGNGDGVAVTGVQSPGFKLMTTNANSSGRNWGLFSNYNQFGDFVVMRSASAESNPYGGVTALAMLSNGNVGIGTAAPLDALHVEATSASNIRLTHTSSASDSNKVSFYEGGLLYGYLNQRGSASSDPGAFYIGNDVPGKPTRIWGGNQMRVTIAGGGDVGIGISNPPILPASNARTLTIQSPANGPGVLELAATSSGPNEYAGALYFISTNAQTAGVYVQADATPTPTTRGYSMQFLTKLENGAVAERMRITSDGNVAIGMAAPTAKLHVGGDIRADGVIYAKFQDLAEWVPSSEDLTPGTVVVLDQTSANQVTVTTRPYDTRVAGVVSAQPGIVLGEGADNKEMVATTGRVKVRVDARQQPIEIGDLLVTSSRPGIAMRSMPLDFAGTEIHRPGTIIGKALEAMPDGEGEILVLLSLQ